MSVWHWRTSARVSTIVLALVVQACYRAAAPPAGDPASSSGSGATTPALVAVLATSVSTRYCAAGDRIGALSLGNGPAFWSAFPKSLDAPELRSTTTQLIAVAYSGSYKAHITGNAHMTGPPPTNPPGTIDVCVETADGTYAIAGQPFIVYGEIPLAGSMIANP
jgi:hypothetical protein